MMDSSATTTTEEDPTSSSSYNLSAFATVAWVILLTILTVELTFLLYYICHLRPTLNRRRPPAEYRDYGKQRHRLIVRLMNRLERNCQKEIKTVVDIDNDDNDGQHDEQLQQQPQQHDFIAEVRQFLLPRFNLPKSEETPLILPKNKKKNNTNNGSSGGGNGNGEYYSSVENTSAGSGSSSSNSISSDLTQRLMMVDTRPETYFPRRQDMDEMLVWALFSKHPHELESWEREELEHSYKLIERRKDLIFEPGKTDGVSVSKLNLDDLNALPKPFFYYLLFRVLDIVGGMVLRYHGFRHYTTTTTTVTDGDGGGGGGGRVPLTYWHRPPAHVSSAKKCGDDPSTEQERDERSAVLDYEEGGTGMDVPNPSSSSSPSLMPSSSDPSASASSPLLFFHGIAPGGPLFYLPVLKHCLCRNEGRDRHMFLFLNKPIGFTMSREAVTEDDTVHGVNEALNTHVGHDATFVLCGHSFGSCPLTWILHGPSSLQDRIEKFILLDPVTILLSEPPVMMNFLHKSFREAWETGPGMFRTWLFASTDIYIEHYLRRHFSWYNSELWLEDIPSTLPTLILICGKDDIIDAPRVKREIEWHREESSSGEEGVGGASAASSKIELVYWDGAGHAECVWNKNLWDGLQERIESLPSRRRLPRPGGGR